MTGSATCRPDVGTLRVNRTPVQRHCADLRKRQPSPGSVTQQSPPFEWRRPWADHNALPNMHIGQTTLRLHGLPLHQRVVVPVVTGTTLFPPPPPLPTT
jgi:hypothetical protein